MNKRVILWVLVSIVVIGSGIYFGYKYLTGTADLEKHIPNDAVMVATANIKSIAGKLDHEKLKNLKMLETLKKMSSGDEKSSKFISEIQKDPLATGINPIKDPYLFFVFENREPIMGLVFALKDPTKFESFLAGLPDLKEKPSGKGDYSTLVLDDELILTWNKKVGILVMAKNEKKEQMARKFINQEETASISSVESYNQFKKNDFDLGFFVNYDRLLSAYATELSASPFAGNFKGVTAHAMLNFEQDEIVAKLNMLDPENSMESANILASDGLSKDMQSVLTNKKAIGLMAVSFIPEKLFKFLKKDPTFATYLATIPQMTGLSEQELESLLGGQLSLCCSDFQDKMVQRMGYDGPEERSTMMPCIILSASVKNKEALNKLMTFYGLSKTGKHWILPMDALSTAVYFVETNAGICITNNEALMQEVETGGKFKYALSDQELALVNDYATSVYLELNRNNYPAPLNKFLDENMGRRIPAFVNDLENFSATGKSNSGTYTLRLKKGKENSINRLIGLFDEIASY